MCDIINKVIDNQAGSGSLTPPGNQQVNPNGGTEEFSVNTKIIILVKFLIIEKIIIHYNSVWHKGLMVPY